MFDGKTFLPLHGIPIPCKARSNTKLADWLPEPLMVPTRIARSLMAGRRAELPSLAARGRTEERTDVMMFLVFADDETASTRRASRRAPTGGPERIGVRKCVDPSTVEHTHVPIARGFSI